MGRTSVYRSEIKTSEVKPMYPTETEWRLHQAHHKELLRIAEQARLLRRGVLGEPALRGLARALAGWTPGRDPLPKRLSPPAERVAAECCPQVAG